MIFVARSLRQKDSFLCRARELTEEKNLSVRASEELNHRWVVTVKGLSEEMEFELQKWVNRNVLREGPA